MEYKKWLTYWKKCLSDSLKSDIDIDKLQNFEIEDFNMKNDVISDLKNVNRLIDFEENRINKKRGIENKDNENWIPINKVQIVITPLKIKPTTEHLVYLKDKNPKFPFWFSAQLDRYGNLQIPDETFPIF